MSWMRPQFIWIFVIVVFACLVFAVLSGDFGLWFHGLSTAVIPKTPFIAKYDFLTFDDKAFERTIYCDGEDYLAIVDSSFKLIENYKQKDKILISFKRHHFHKIDFLEQTPSVCFYEPAFVSHWETIPLGEKEIAGIVCRGFQRNGLQTRSPLNSLLNLLSLKVGIVEDPTLEKKRKERGQLWFAQDTGILVKGDGYTLKNLSKWAPDPKQFQVPADYEEVWLP